MKNQKGQAILFVIVAVTIALAVGVTVSTRNLTSISRISRTDTSARAYAAAEGGIERLLKYNLAQLDTLAACSKNHNCNAGSPNACQKAGLIIDDTDNSRCLINFPPVPDESLQSRARVKVETVAFNGPNYYYFDVQVGNTKEIVLMDSVKTYCPATATSCKIKICWSNKTTALYYFSYNADGNVLRGGLVPSSGFPYNASISGFVTEDESGGPEYPYCNTVALVKNPYGLRIKPLYNDTKVAIFPSPSSYQLPDQGYALTSLGELTEEGRVKESKVVKVFRSPNYLPAIFDYAIYTGGDL